MRTAHRTGAVAAVVALGLLSACAQEGPPIEEPSTAQPTPPERDDQSSAPTEGVSTGGVADALTGTSTASQEPTGPMEITVGAAGDILTHAPVIANAKANADGGDDDYDFSPMFADVAALLTSPDLTLCHLETPLSEDNTNLTVPRTLVFNTPHQMADALAGAGYDGCDFASNHAWDRGLEGLAQTERVIRAAGLEYAGPVADETDAGRPATYNVDGVKVAQLAYSYTLLNAGMANTDVPDGAPWLADYLWLGVGADGILADARQAKEDGADFVVVSMHWGNEYQTDPTEQQQEIAEELLTSDAVDLILGTHVHVIQPCEKINGKYVIYGLGNFLSNQSPDTTAGKLRRATQEGMIAHVTLSKDEEGEVTSTMTYQPTRVDLEGHVIRLATPDQHPETYERVVETVHLLGEDACDAKPMS